VLWFFIGLFVGLVLDFLLVVHMLWPIRKRLASLGDESLCVHEMVQRLHEMVQRLAREPEHGQN